MANDPTPDYLAGLTQLSHRTICGGLDKQEIFYRADEVAALVDKLNVPVADAELVRLRNELGIATTQCNVYRGSYRNFADAEVEWSGRLMAATDLLNPLAEAGNELATQIMDKLWGDHPRLAADSLPGLLTRLRVAEAKVAPAGILSNGDFVNRLVELAKAYRPSAQASIARNSHMYDLPLGEESVPDQSQIDAVLTNFLNHVGVSRGLDLGLYSSDLASQEKEAKRV